MWTNPFPNEFAIDLPDLEGSGDSEIVADNLLAAQGLYFAAMLEQLKLFGVADQVVAHFAGGKLPVGRGKAGEELYRYWRKRSGRLTESERRTLYSHTFGFTGGDSATGAPNSEFADLWGRFLAAVSAFAGAMTPGDPLGPFADVTKQTEVKQSALGLARNLSLHGSGLAYFAAVELQAQIREIIDLLSDPEILSAYGARNLWQVIDQVASLDLGGANNSLRSRTMALSGAAIIRWLAKNRKRITVAGDTAILLPGDLDLIDACESWLSVAGIGDDPVDR